MFEGLLVNISKKLGSWSTSRVWESLGVQVWGQFGKFGGMVIWRIQLLRLCIRVCSMF